MSKKKTGTFPFSHNLRYHAKHPLKCAKRAVEIAIEQDEQAAINSLESVSTQIPHLVGLKTSHDQKPLKIRDNPRNPCHPRFRQLVPVKIRKIRDNPRFAVSSPKYDLHSDQKQPPILKILIQTINTLHNNRKGPTLPPFLKI